MWETVKKICLTFGQNEKKKLHIVPEFKNTGMAID
jgi:hypothetical protein